jgi:hypothetical protein
MYVQHKFGGPILPANWTNTHSSMPPITNNKRLSTDYFDRPKFQGGNESKPLLSTTHRQAVQKQRYADEQQRLAYQNMTQGFEKSLKSAKAKLEKRQEEYDTLLKELAFLAFEHSLYTRKVNLYKYGGTLSRRWDNYQVDYLPAEVEGIIDQKRIRKLTHSHSLINWNAETVLLDVLGDRGWENFEPRMPTTKNKRKLTPEDDEQLSEIEKEQKKLATEMTELKEELAPKLLPKQKEIKQCQKEISRIKSDWKKFNEDFKK